MTHFIKGMCYKSSKLGNRMKIVIKKDKLPIYLNVT